jgi:MFS family permease
MYVAGTTMITAAHRPEERGRVQGAAEMAIAAMAVVASFASAGLLSGLGWEAVNLGAVPVLMAVACLTLWFAWRRAGRVPIQA